MDIILPTTVDSLQYIILLTNGRHSLEDMVQLLFICLSYSNNTLLNDIIQLHLTFNNTSPERRIFFGNNFLHKNVAYL